ncbi:MAG: hypothetical protein IJE04_03225 [Bacilli bacterium]|nr:hypothetical protein [Bacilli bacterium]
MVTSINDEIRKKIININSKELTILNLEKLSSDMYDKVISLFLLDYYKINFFMGNVDYLDDFNDTKENIIERTLKDENFLFSIIENSIIFNELCITSKMMILEELSDMGQDDILMQISKLHIFDKITYNFDYNLETFKEYYNDYKNKNKKHPKKIDVSYFIATKLVNYKDIRYDEFKKMVLEFIKVYYKWNVFVRDNCPKNSLYKEDYFYLEMIRLNKLDILIEYIGENIDFLTSLIQSYLFYTTTSKQISKAIVDDYFYKNVDVETQKKLKLKRD